MLSAISTHVGGYIEQIEYEKWRGTVAGANGSICGILSRARRVVKYNPVDNSVTEIGPDFGKYGMGASGMEVP